ISTDPTFEASGHVAGAALDSAICAGEHAARPFASEVLTVTPAGSVTTASFKFAAESPPRSCNPADGICRSTCSPVGESATLESGTTSIDGANGNLLHPSNPTGLPDLSLVTNPAVRKLPGASHGSADNVNSCGPPHDVGNVKNGRGEVFVEA